MTTAARPTPRRWRDADASPNPQAHSRPKTRRSRGDHGISWDKINKCYVGTISLGYDTTGKRRRRTVTGKTKAQVKDKLITLREEISAGVQTPATYTVEQCVRDWLDSLAIDPGTIATYRGQAEKWIYPRIGAAKLKDLKVTDIELFFGDIAKVLRRPSLVAIKSTLRRSIRRAQKHDLIIRNVAELADVPDCQPGRPSRAMTEEQAAQVLAAASGIAGVYRTVVTIGRYPGAAAHAATAANDLACGTRPRTNATFAHVSDDLAAATCWSCRAKLGLDSDTDALARLEALVVLAITLGLRSGELRALTWDHVDLDNGIIHVWRSTRRGGDTKTRKSRRSLVLPNRAIDALRVHQKRQVAERLAAGAVWHDHNLMFCHEDGRPYTRYALNWRFGQVTRRAGIGHWHAHEARHTAVSIMSKNGVPIQEISDTMGHASTHVTEVVYRKQIVPTIRGGAAVMDAVFSISHADTCQSGTVVT